MAKTPTNLSIDQGATFSTLIVWTDSTGAAKNLYSYSARMALRPTYGSNNIVTTLTTANGEITTSANGEISLYLSPERTAAIPVDYNQTAKPPKTAYVYDLEVVCPDGNVTRLLYGTAYVIGEVTR